MLAWTAAGVGDGRQGPAGVGGSSSVSARTRCWQIALPAARKGVLLDGETLGIWGIVAAWMDVRYGVLEVDDGEV